MLQIKKTDDLILRDAIEAALQENKEEFGERYCPCSLEHSKDTICMCKMFREQTEPGPCHCGLYEKF